MKITILFLIIALLECLSAARTSAVPSVWPKGKKIGSRATKETSVMPKRFYFGNSSKPTVTPLSHTKHTSYEYNTATIDDAVETTIESCSNATCERTLNVLRLTTYTTNINGVLTQMTTVLPSSSKTTVTPFLDISARRSNKPASQTSSSTRTGNTSTESTSTDASDYSSTRMSASSSKPVRNTSLAYSSPEKSISTGVSRISSNTSSPATTTATSIEGQTENGASFAVPKLTSSFGHRLSNWSILTQLGALRASKVSSQNEIPTSHFSKTLSFSSTEARPSLASSVGLSLLSSAPESSITTSSTYQTTAFPQESETQASSKELSSTNSAATPSYTSGAITGSPAVTPSSSEIYSSSQTLSVLNSDESLSTVDVMTGNVITQSRSQPSSSSLHMSSTTAASVPHSVSYEAGASMKSTKILSLLVSLVIFL